MTNNVKLDLYNAIEQRLLDEVSEIKHVRHYNSQDFNLDQIIERNYPQAYIQFSSIEWLPCELKPYNENLTQQQKGNIQVSVYVHSFSLLEDNDTIKDDLTLINKVYRKLSMFEGENFTPLQRVSEVDDIDNNNLRLWQIVFSTMVTECAVDDELTDASPVELDINKTFIIPPHL